MTEEDSPKLPRATLRDEKLYVEGEEKPYFRDPEHTIRLRIEALTIHRAIGSERPKNYRECLNGIAKLERNNEQFAVAGLKTDRETPIKFDLWPVLDTETKVLWSANIGFQRWDLEQWFSIQGYCPRQLFDDLLAAVRRGHVDYLRVVMKTTMWTRQKHGQRTWHLAPPKDNEIGNISTYESGNISLLIWEEKFGAHPTEKIADESDEPTTPKPQLVDLPTQVYSTLNKLIWLVAALLGLTFITFLRHW